MTCIVALKDGDKCFIGGDSRGSSGHTGSLYKRPKVFKSFDCREILFGYTTSFRMGQILEFSEGLFDELSLTNGIDFKYMVKSFIPNIQDRFNSEGFETSVNGEKTGGNFIICVNDKIYNIQNDYSILEPSLNFTSCGCGEDFANASLFSTVGSKMTPIERIHLALKAASYFSEGVRGPFTIINTKDDEVITLD